MVLCGLAAGTTATVRVCTECTDYASFRKPIYVLLHVFRIPGHADALTREWDRGAATPGVITGRAHDAVAADGRVVPA